MKVLFLCDGLAPFVIGGMQQHSTMLVKHLAPLVDHITLMHCGKVNEDPPKEADVFLSIGKPSNVEIIGVKFEDRGSFPGHYLRASKRLSLSFLRKAGALNVYDIVYAQGLTGDAFLRQHKKVVVNLHGLEMFQASFSWNERLAKAWMRPIFRRHIREAWHCISLGGNLTNLLYKQGAIVERVVQIPNGIEERWMLSAEHLEEKLKMRRGKKLRFIMVGRNEYRKGLHVLQEALEMLNEPIELHMIGDWPRWDAGIHKVIHHGVIGNKSELMTKLDHCDVLLLPSLSEGMPTVVLEAMARGLSILATDVGAMQELVDKADLMQPSSARDLADRMRSTPSRAKASMEQFLWENVALQTVESFD